MSRKFFVIYLIVLALVLAGLIAAYAVTGTSAVIRDGAEFSGDLPFANSMVRHPNPGNSSALAGSDWIERHPDGLRLNYLVGSDWIERHPPVVADADYYAGSDWIERHPSNYYFGSDWIERHPDTAALEE